MPDFIALYSVVIVLFALIYFFIASITFLFVRLDTPEVWRLFRGLFSSYFWAVGATGLLATAMFAANGRITFAIGLLLLAAAALAARATVLTRIDNQHVAVQSGDAGAMRRLRHIHLAAMLVNGAVLASVASSLPHIL